MVQIYFAYTDVLTSNNPDRLQLKLSKKLKAKLSQLRRDEDQRLFLTSMVLLTKALSNNGCDKFTLNHLDYDKAGRPFFTDSSFDFNISHTDNCAVVAFSKDCRVGIDVEKINEINFFDFEEYFTGEQWNVIYSAPNQLDMFYYYWTLIESGAKADGRGLSLITLNKINLVNKILFVDNTRWYYYHYNFDKSISCCVTTDKENKSYEFIKVTSL
jgi:4'-phosphopantetheinyl transferase